MKSSLCKLSLLQSWVFPICITMNAARIARKDQIKLSEWKCSHNVKNPFTMQIEEKILNFQIEEKF